jgi:hypothetical protein
MDGGQEGVAGAWPDLELKPLPQEQRREQPLQQIANLPPEERRQIMQLVDAFIERSQLKRRVAATSNQSAK